MSAARYTADPQMPELKNAVFKARGVRRLHRSIATLFSLAVAANVLIMPWRSPPIWITYAPLPPLLFLLATGLIMLVKPRIAAARRAQRGHVR